MRRVFAPDKMIDVLVKESRRATVRKVEKLKKLVKERVRKSNPGFNRLEVVGEIPKEVGVTAALLNEAGFRCNFA